MTRHQDAERRRQQLGEALLVTIAEHGLERTTLRRVADRADVSVGLVQRYFATKHELLRFGIEYVYDRTRERVAAVEIRSPVRSVLFDIAEALLPLDDERERESRVWLAFAQATMNDAALREIHHHATHQLIDGLEQAFAGAQRAGELDPVFDARQEAEGLTALLDGLTLNALITQPPFDRQTVRQAIRRHLDRLFESNGA